MTPTRLSEIRAKWQGGTSDFAADVRDLLSALDAHREAVRVAAEAINHWTRWLGDELPDESQRVVDATNSNPIIAAAIKSAQEHQQ